MRSMPGLRWMTALLIGSLALRLTALWILAAHQHGTETAHHEHQSIAASLARGEGFRFNFFGPLEEPVLTSQQAPLVPGLLAGCYVLFGIETPTAMLAMLLLQLVVSSVTVVGLSWLAFLLTQSRSVCRWTGVAAACYPPLLISGLHVQALVWNLFWLTLLLLGTVRYRAGSKGEGALLFVIAAVGSLWTDPILSVVIGLLMGLLGWDYASNRQQAQRWEQARLAAMAVAILAGIAPWLYRNYVVHDRFVWVKDSLPYVFWQGNNRISQGTDKLLVKGNDARQLGRVWDPEKANREAFDVRRRAISVNVCLTTDFISQLQAMPSEIARMDCFRQLAIEQLCEQPGHYAMLCVRRLWYWLWFDATNPRSYLWHYRVSYLSLLALAVPGLWLWARPVTGWLPVYLAAGGLTCVHVLIITSARFRIPLELLLLPAAGLACSKVLTSWKRDASLARRR